jgi:integrase
LRVGEVARLKRIDVDLDRRLLVIRETKFAKSRLVPFGPHMAERLAGYLELRAGRSGTTAHDAPVFSFMRGRAIHPCTISQTFHALVPHLDLAVPAGVEPPRVHDLRHSFAVGTLLRWYRDGGDPAARLLHLSTFLGHVDPASTAVYLTITADLLKAAGERFERFAAPLSTGAVR